MKDTFFKGESVIVTAGEWATAKGKVVSVIDGASPVIRVRLNGEQGIFAFAPEQIAAQREP